MPDSARKRCSWVNVDNALMLEYHDVEWGVPTHDDRKHFEFLVLEGAQAGLSWSIILNKRDGYRRAFSQFDPSKVARYTDARIDKLVADDRIIRNRAKINGAVKNAQAFLEVQEEFDSFDAYCWQFVNGSPRQNRWRSMNKDSRVDSRIGRVQPRSQTSWILIRRNDDHLRAHASGRNGQRPRGRLFSTS